MKTKIKLQLVFVMLISGFFSSCQKEHVELKVSQSGKYNTFYGPQKQVGNDSARTFARISHEGMPQEIGVIFTAKALTGLPAENTFYSLAFHQKAIKATLFEHVVVGLSAHGHVMPPDGFIGPHFDVRFFMMTEEERLAIPAPPAAGFDLTPPSNYLPPNYVKNSAQAQIGRHWAESIFTAAETVNSAMVYGTWNGQVTFLAPIVTLATLSSGQSYSVTYPQPQYFARHGYYATMYNIYTDDKGRIYVSLSNFVWR
jgi:hypothetical protein